MDSGTMPTEFSEEDKGGLWCLALLCISSSDSEPRLPLNLAAGSELTMDLGQATIVQVCWTVLCN